jgi:hypothetical protein
MARLQTEMFQCLEKSRAAELGYSVEVSASLGMPRIGIGLDPAELPAIVMFGEKRKIV